MAPKLSINLISNHTQEEVEAMASKVEQLALNYFFPRDKILHDFAELQRVDFSVSEFKYLQLSLVVGILKENPGSWFEEHKDSKVGDFIPLLLDIALRISTELVLARFRASGIQVLSSGKFVFMSDRLSESELADRAVDGILWEKELREFAAATGWTP